MREKGKKKLDLFLSSIFFVCLWFASPFCTSKKKQVGRKRKALVNTGVLWEVGVLEKVERANSKQGEGEKAAKGLFCERAGLPFVFLCVEKW